MNAATNLLPSKFGKPPLDLIDPRRRCWREVHRVCALRAVFSTMFDVQGVLRGSLVGGEAFPEVGAAEAAGVV